MRKKEDEKGWPDLQQILISSLSGSGREYKCYYINPVLWRSNREKRRRKEEKKGRENAE